MRFQDDVVVVTGASRGIGREIACEFGNEGAKVACIATSEANAAPTADAVMVAGGAAKAYGLNVADSAAVDEVFAKIAEDFGAPTILINNAGITRDGLAMRMKDEDFDAVINTNLRGAFLCSRAVMKGMMKARRGRIVNISSIVGLHGAAGQANYSASKAGLIGMTMSLAKELGSRGITVNAVAPGFIETDMTHDLSDDFKEYVCKTAPAGRLGSAADIASAVLFLASDDASYMTGQVLTVDGGLSL